MKYTKPSNEDIDSKTYINLCNFYETVKTQQKCRVRIYFTFVSPNSLHKISSRMIGDEIRKSLIYTAGNSTECNGDTKENSQLYSV